MDIVGDATKYAVRESDETWCVERFKESTPAHKKWKKLDGAENLIRSLLEWLERK